MSTVLLRFHQALAQQAAKHNAKDAGFKHASVLLGTATEHLEDASRQRDRTNAHAHLELANALIKSVQGFLEQVGSVNRQLGGQQSPWMAACASYLRKAKRYWRGEGDVNGSSSPSTNTTPDWTLNTYATWTKRGNIDIMQGQSLCLTLAPVHSQHTRDFGDLNVFETVGREVPDEVGIIHFHAPSQDILLRVSHQGRNDRWIVVAKQCPLVARED